MEALIPPTERCPLIFLKPAASASFAACPVLVDAYSLIYADKIGRGEFADAFTVCNKCGFDESADRAFTVSTRHMYEAEFTGGSGKFRKKCGDAFKSETDDVIESVGIGVDGGVL